MKEYRQFYINGREWGEAGINEHLETKAIIGEPGLSG